MTFSVVIYKYSIKHGYDAFATSAIRISLFLFAANKLFQESCYSVLQVRLRIHINASNNVLPKPPFLLCLCLLRAWCYINITNSTRASYIHEHIQSWLSSMCNSSSYLHTIVLARQHLLEFNRFEIMWKGGSERETPRWRQRRDRDNLTGDKNSNTICHAVRIHVSSIRRAPCTASLG